MLKGCDISKHQGDVNFDALKQAFDFILIRSSYGVGYRDLKFDRNRDEARRVGLLRGFYHYAYPQYNEPEAEANYFCDVIGTPQEGELLILDLEENKNSAKPWNGDSGDWAIRFLDTVKARMNGYKPLFYSYKSYLTEYNFSRVVAGDYGLWLAHFDNKQNPSEENTPWAFVAIKQYWNKGNVAGINPLDLDVFNGNGETFLKYGYHAPQAQQTVVSQPEEQIPVSIPETPATPEVAPVIVPETPVETPALPEEKVDEEKPVATVPVFDQIVTDERKAEAKKYGLIVLAVIWNAIKDLKLTFSGVYSFLKAGLWDGIKKLLKIFFYVSLAAIANFLLQVFAGMHFHDIPLHYQTFSFLLTDDIQNLAMTAFLNGFYFGFVKWVSTKAETLRKESNV